MKPTQNLLAAVTLSVGLLSATGANAALESALGGQVVNDTDLNITWLANANLAATETFGVGGIDLSGHMSWNTAQSWIGAMNTDNYLGFNDWRLSTADPSCGFAYNCTGSEMGHLFYNELGGVANQSITTTHNANYGLFQNVQSYEYWSGTEYAPDLNRAWNFSTLGGNQSAFYKEDRLLLAWAVRPGQVVSAVPEPETYVMLLAGLGLIGFMTLRRKQNFAA